MHVSTAFNFSKKLEERGYLVFPENIELIAILRNIYGQDFIDIFEKSLEDIEENFTESDQKLVKK